MCSYVTEQTAVQGSAKGPSGWFRLSRAVVAFDHPYHASLDHALTIDFLDPAAGPEARVAVELSAESARQLVRCIEAALTSPAAAAG
jgi:hypothetical protein